MSKDDALRWFADLFGLPVESISPATSRSEIPAWDSLGVLMLMGGLDESFGIVVNDEEMRTMQKIDDVLELLRANGKMRP